MNKFIIITVFALRYNSTFRKVLKASAPLLSHQQRRKHSNKKNEYDLVVVGGGIVGTAAAREMILRQPRLKIALLEKEKELAMHQSSHNSGILYTGINFAPGSQKARLCMDGLCLAYKYLDEKRIPYKRCGKLVVATNRQEVKWLKNLYHRGVQNGVPDLKILNADEIRKLEPYCRGIQALVCPHTSIVDFAQVTKEYGKDFKIAGGQIYFGFEAYKFVKDDHVDYPVIIRGSKVGQEIRTRYVLTCGGLQSDNLAQLTGCRNVPKIVAFRGEYLQLAKEKCSMVRGNIFAVPNPTIPFWDVHFTPRMDGNVWFGPYIALALQREGYKWSDVDLDEVLKTVQYPGFAKMASKYFAVVLSKMSESAFSPFKMKGINKYIQQLSAKDLQAGPTGVRAQAINLSGNFVEDAIFKRGDDTSILSKNVLHCCNVPSPGATNSLAFATVIADKLEEEFNLCSVSKVGLLTQ